MTRGSPIHFVGTLPPPVTGMTLATEVVVDRLRARCGVRIHDISHPTHHRGPRWRLIKAWKAATGTLRLLTWSSGGRPRVYMVANSGHGIWYNLAHALAARARRHHVFLHHQVYSYVNDTDARMRRLVRTLGPGSTHIVLCDAMGAAFRERYEPDGEVVVVPNSIIMLARARPLPARPRTPFRLGHLSNLTVEKGLADVLSTLAAARDRGLPVELVLAGPPANAEAAALLSDARDRFGEALDYRGPVYDDAKRAFYDDIDVLLFPTRYEREAYPLVLAEALTAGAPVIAYGRACIPTLIGTDGGWTVDPAADFAVTAADLVEGWLRDPDAYAAATERARARAGALRVEAERALEALLDRMCDS